MSNVQQQKFTFFWKTLDCLSQWHPSLFVAEGIQFVSAEQYMMYKKAEKFNDTNTMVKITACNEHPLFVKFIEGHIHASDIINDEDVLREWDKLQRKFKDLGRGVRGYADAIWASSRYGVVVDGNRYKHSQNPQVMAFLMGTEFNILVEASPFDKIWGIGLRAEHKNATNPEMWKGLNLLGDVHMELREEFKKGT